MITDLPVTSQDLADDPAQDVALTLALDGVEVVVRVPAYLILDSFYGVVDAAAGITETADYAAAGGC